MQEMQETKRHGFDPWIGKIPWRRKWKLTQVLLPGKFQGQKSLLDYMPWARKELDTTEHMCMDTCIVDYVSFRCVAK